jgi:hypothetical protein
MKNEQIAEAIFAALEQLMQEAGPEWTLEFINAGLAESVAETVNPRMQPKKIAAASIAHAGQFNRNLKGVSMWRV